MNSYLILIVIVLASGFASLAGCVPKDDSEAVQQLATTVASVSEKAVEEQSRLNLRVADATDSLVKADSEARTAMIQAHEHIQLKLQAERASLDQRRQDLDSLKDRVEGERLRTPVIAESIQSVGGVFACLCPLLLAAYILYSMNLIIESDQERIVNQFLIEELTSDSPVLLPAAAPSNLLEDQQQLHLLATLNPESDEEPPF